MVKLLSSKAKPPIKGTTISIEYDLFTSQDYVLLSGARALLHTDMPLNCQKEHVAPPSGVASAYGLDVGAGVIDPDYRGKIKDTCF